MVVGYSALEASQGRGKGNSGQGLRASKQDYHGARLSEALNKTQRLAMELLRETLKHWEQFGEPISAQHLAIRFGVMFARLKSDVYFSTFLETLETAGLFKVIRIRSGKRWVFSRDVWDGLSSKSQANWLIRVSDRSDPIYDFDYASGLTKTKADD